MRAAHAHARASTTHENERAKKTDKDRDGDRDKDTDRNENEDEIEVAEKVRVKKWTRPGDGSPLGKTFLRNGTSSNLYTPLCAVGLRKASRPGVAALGSVTTSGSAARPPRISCLGRDGLDVQRGNTKSSPSKSSESTQNLVFVFGTTDVAMPTLLGSEEILA